jgi:hypothetical protein
MKRFAFGFLLLGLALGFKVATAQNAAAPAAAVPQELFQFGTLSHDFGDIKEEGGDVSHSFKFTNKGKAPLVITDVKASCGCTTPNWTKEKIQPGQDGFVAASYAPLYRPGPFEKFVTVKGKFDDEKDERVVVLTIRGKVTPRTKTVADFYPHKSGNLRFTTNHVGVGKLAPGKSATGSLGIYNEGAKPIKILGYNVPEHVKHTLAPGTVLNPKDSVKIAVTFDAAKVNDWGFVYFRGTLATDDDQDKDKVVYASADIQDDYSKLSPEERANLGHINFPGGMNHNFGVIKSGDVVTHEFQFTNTGKSDLIIRKTQASCGCTATHPTKSVLKPGESSSISVKFDSTGKQGKEQKTVTVITNDPDRTTLYLTIDADITPAAGGNTGAK